MSVSTDSQVKNDYDIRIFDWPIKKAEVLNIT